MSRYGLSAAELPQPRRKAAIPTIYEKLIEEFREIGNSKSIGMV
jgi:hypothetical protein